MQPLKTLVGALIRHGIAVIAGILFAKGWADKQAIDGIVNADYSAVITNVLFGVLALAASILASYVRTAVYHSRLGQKISAALAASGATAATSSNSPAPGAAAPEPSASSPSTANATKALLAAVLLLPLLSLGGCATATGAGDSGGAWVPTAQQLALIQTGSQIATGAVLTFAVTDPAQRTALANEIYSASNALDSLAGGTVPTPDQLAATVLSFGGSSATAQYVGYVSNLKALYATYFPQLTGNPKAAVQVIEEIAAGSGTAASAYATLTH